VISNANAAVFCDKPQILDLENAISRVGLSATKRVALGVAMVQLNKSKELLSFSNISRAVWLHSVYTAAAAFVISKEMTSIQPEESQIAGLLVNLGGFYMLYRAREYEILRQSPDDVRQSAGRHYLALTQKVLQYIGLPKDMLESLQITMAENTSLKVPPTTAREVIRTANILASQRLTWDEGIGHTEEIPRAYLDLQDKIEKKYEELLREYV
jgi:HD-like signal output (HDOD) protein